MTPTKPTQMSIDAAQAVFDALDAYIAGTPWVSASASVTFDGGATTHMMNAYDRTNTGSFNYTQRTAGVRVAVAPTMATLGPGATQQFTATATDAAGVPIAAPVFTWTVSGAGLGTVSATGLYTAPATIAAAVADVVTASLEDQTAWTAITVQLQP